MKIHIRYILILLFYLLQPSVHAEEVCIIDRPPLLNGLKIGHTFILNLRGN